MASKFAFISLVLSCSLLSLIQTQTTVQPDQVIGFIRHGSRGPLSGYDSTWLSSEWGMLTATGMRQEFLLGRIIADRYSGVFGDTYDPFYIYGLSDYTYRCVESLVAVFDGIYYGTGPQLRSNQNPSVAVPPFVDSSVQDILNSLTNLNSIPGQRAPVVVDTVTSSTETIFARFLDDSYCNNAETWVDQNNADSATTAAWTTFKPTITKVNSYLSSSNQLTTPYAVTIYGDFMLVDVHDQRVLPGGLTDQDVINEFIIAYSWFVFHQEYAQLTQRQVSAYYPVKEILKQLNYYVTGSYYLYNGLLYGAHDYNIYAILAAFNVVNDTCIIANYNSYLSTKTLAYPACVFPDFAANIFFELYYTTTTTTTPYVKFYYNNIWVPLCSGKDCTYTAFVTFANNAIGNMTSTTFKTACGN